MQLTFAWPRCVVKLKVKNPQFSSLIRVKPRYANVMHLLAAARVLARITNRNQFGVFVFACQALTLMAIRLRLPPQTYQHLTSPAGQSARHHRKLPRRHQLPLAAGMSRLQPQLLPQGLRLSTRHCPLGFQAWGALASTLSALAMSLPTRQSLSSVKPTRIFPFMPAPLVLLWGAVVVLGLLHLAAGMLFVSIMKVPFVYHGPRTLRRLW